jgi:SAM-dependent methyltransferase/NAD(P)-dependent dehydrogenase (short-subunit alcohol dehydrogenase family)
MADATVTEVNKNMLKGNVDLFDPADSRVKVQARGVQLTAVGQRRDPWLYAGTTWLRDVDHGIEPGMGYTMLESDKVLHEQLTRTAFYFLRQLRKKILPQELILMGKYRRHMMTWVLKHLMPQIDAGEHPEIRPEWKSDTLEMIQKWRASQPADNIDMNILHAMGKNLINIVRGTTPPLRVLTQDGMLNRLYVEGLGTKAGNVDLGALVNQLAHQYPRMRIVEIGSGTGNTTRIVLDALANRYTSYTYTDISTDVFETARKRFDQQTSKLTFKTLNIENSPVNQGFNESAFDMVVASNCLHATRSLDETLHHCRKLLRPGGRLVLLEITRDFLPMQLIMSTLPGWFSGIDDGRVWAPTVGVQQWDKLLKANGFSGVDVSSTPSFCSVMLAQAVDEKIKLLREPLSFFAGAPPLKDMIIVGGGSSTKLVSQCQEILKVAVPSSTVTVVPELEQIQVLKGAIVLCLCDLNQPVFRAMNETRFRGLQDIMETAEVLLWVTSGARSGEDPDANITLGLSSTLRAERMDLRLQFIDVDDPSSVDPYMVAKMLLRVAFLDPSTNDELLWTQEPELALRRGAFYIPRVVALDTVNRRTTARLRQVTQTTSIDSTNETVVINDCYGKLELQAAPLSGIEEGKIRLQVTASSLQALSLNEDASSYACIGRDHITGDKLLALSTVNSSTINVSEADTLHRWQDGDNVADDSVMLQQFLNVAAAKNLLRGLSGPIWVHGAAPDMSQAIDLIARELGVAVVQTISDMAMASDARFIHPFADEEALYDVRPRGLQNFINLAVPRHEAIHAMVSSSLSASAIRANGLEQLYSHWSVAELRSLAQRLVHDNGTVSTKCVQAVRIEETAQVQVESMKFAAVFDWTTASTVNTTIHPMNHHGLFVPDKTYLLCGMTGDLGVSVCLWMIENGARNVVLASRKPNVSANVLQFMSRKGAVVRPMAVDITDMESLRRAYNEIKADMPPIGGVMNAAMILRDRLFHQIPWEDFATVLAPKVAGSKNLDELLGDEQLEFFICFSSVTSIVGSIGQSAYAAANHYMASLIRRRIQRGLSGSIVHIGVLTGFGYIFRQNSEHAETIHKAILPRFDRQSETDLHEMLAEAIVCGRIGSGQTSDLITGIRPVFQGDWRDDPRLSCYTGHEQLEGESTQGQGVNTMSVKAELVATTEPADWIIVLERRFAMAIGNLLEINPEQLDSSMPIASLGIDSLVAIRIREWFLKELGVDVPVLKVMSDSYSVSRMCNDVLVGWRKLDKP